MYYAHSRTRAKSAQNMYTTAISDEIDAINWSRNYAEISYPGWVDLQSFNNSNLEYDWATRCAYIMFQKNPNHNKSFWCQKLFLGQKDQPTNQCHWVALNIAKTTLMRKLHAMPREPVPSNDLPLVNLFKTTQLG